jgi:hypothetical protein
MQKLALMRAAEAGRIPEAQISGLDASKGVTAPRMAKMAALTLGLNLVTPVVTALWLHSFIVPESGAAQRLIEISSRWTRHGTRSVLLTEPIPEFFRKHCIETVLPGELASSWVLNPQVPSLTEPLAHSQFNTLGVAAVGGAFPVARIRLYDDQWGAVEHAEDYLSFEFSRAAANVFPGNWMNHSKRIMRLLEEEVPRLHAEAASDPDSPEPLVPHAYFLPSPGKFAPRPTEDILRPSSPGEKWAMLSGITFPLVDSLQRQQQQQQRR